LRRWLDVAGDDEWYVTGMEEREGMVVKCEGKNLMLRVYGKSVIFI
jgi:hypothetical protein